MKNKLIDLNNHLFAQMERLSNEDLIGDELKVEMERSKAITGVATAIINNGKLALEAQKELGHFNRLPEMLGIEADNHD